MKYWKGKAGTDKAGQVGTRDDNGDVPDSFPCSKHVYDIYVNSIPVPVISQSDIERLVIYAKKEGWI